MIVDAALVIDAVADPGRRGQAARAALKSVPAAEVLRTPGHFAFEVMSGLRSAVNRPQLRINLDLYHTQIGEGDLIRWCQACLPWIGEVQVADNPGRCQPGTGEINYAGVAKALKDMGYAGPVGMEAFAMGDEEAALDAFVQAFSV